MPHTAIRRLRKVTTIEGVSGRMATAVQAA
jgi:hypothetical protein